MKSGTIHVQTENIFPIIKKVLYSDHEIFLRELVSNAVDACQKLKALRSLGEAPGSEDAFRVDISLNKENKTLTISDNGIGMTEAEIEKYINQIAFSGAEEFVNKYKDKTDAAGIIGHFGLGFYSAFMVAGKVEIHTRSFKSDAEAVEWSCLGNPDVQMGPGKREKHGTDVVLHISHGVELSVKIFIIFIIQSRWFFYPCRGCIVDLFILKRDGYRKKFTILLEHG